MQIPVKPRRNITERLAYLDQKISQYIVLHKEDPELRMSELRGCRLRRYRKRIFRLFNQEQIEQLKVSEQQEGLKCTHAYGELLVKKAGR